jgi:hypothetical protein
MLREGRLQEWQRAAKERSAKGFVVARRLVAIHRWDGDVWQATLLGLKDGAWRLPIFRRVAALMIAAPDSFFADRGGLYNVSWAVASWICATTRGLPAEQEEVFWQLWDRVAPVAFTDAEKRVEAPSEEADETVPTLRDNDAVTAAINDPAGILTQSLLHRLDVRKPRVGDGLPLPVRERLTEITDGSGRGHRLGRVVLARSLPVVHAIDSDWTAEHLLRWFDWSIRAGDISALWFGYLTSGNPGSPDLFFALRGQLINCIDHEKELGSAFEQCWQLIVLAAFEIPNAFAIGQVKKLLRRSETGRKKAAFAILRYMPEDRQGEPPRGASYWHSRVGPWITAEWPQDKNMRSSEISEHFALAALQSGGMFPEAVGAIAPFLIPLSDHSFLLHRVANSDHPEEHPERCLFLLGKLIDTNTRPFLVEDLRDILKRISEADQACRNDDAWKRLSEFVLASGLVT